MIPPLLAPFMEHSHTTNSTRRAHLQPSTPKQKIETAFTWDHRQWHGTEEIIGVVVMPKMRVAIFLDATKGSTIRQLAGLWR